MTESQELVDPLPAPEGPAPSRIPWWRRRVAMVLGGIATGLLVAVVCVAEYTLHHLEPIVRQQLLKTLSESFNSPVELDALHISLLRGVEVDGEGLRIPFGYSPNADATPRGGPMVSVQHFRFRTTLGALLHHTTHIDEFRAERVEIHIPPHDRRFALLGELEGKLPADPLHRKLRSRVVFTLSHLVNDDVKLFLETDTPGKEALEFDIRHLELSNVGPNESSAFTADFVNARPRGGVHTAGHLGPWASDDPRETPVDGDFTFSNADLGTIKGIGGTLQGAGHVSGKLDAMDVDGAAQVPNFWLDTAHHPMPLRTRFHATVDGSTGDVTLAAVQARLGRSDFTTTGKIAKLPAGHDIALDVDVPAGQAADFLQLAVQTTPPLMNGALRLKAKLHIPPGPVRVPIKMGLVGRFQVRSVRFNNLKFQNQVDGLSARAQGHPEEVKSVSHDEKAEAVSEMSADIVLAHGLLTASGVQYTLPGAVVGMNGAYSMDGNVFEFKGHVRTEATASQMVGGWKGMLLLPLDRLLKKDGAGLELPIQISGTQGDVRVGLALQGADDSPQAMAQDLKNRKKAAASATGKGPNRP